MRVVLDTNVLMPALFGHGVCEALLDQLLDRPDVEIVLSEYILDEIRHHATRKFRVPKAEMDRSLASLAEACVIVEPATIAPGTVRDDADLPVLGTAVAGRADALVTGDKALLALRQSQGIPIMTPRALLDQMM